LGGAEVPVRIASAAISPFAVSLCLVAGVCVARWTIPALLKGSDYVFSDLKDNQHLIVWGVLAGALLAVANTLTVFAIRDVGLAIAFPLWNTNCLVGIFWGWLLFNELSIPTNHPVAPKTNCHHHLSFDHGCCVVHEIFEGPRRPGYRT
jgi:drug/metabolite transporter (DMT)-like permease